MTELLFPVGLPMLVVLLVVFLRHRQREQLLCLFGLALLTAVVVLFTEKEMVRRAESENTVLGDLLVAVGPIGFVIFWVTLLQFLRVELPRILLGGATAIVFMLAFVLLVTLAVNLGMLNL